MVEWLSAAAARNFRPTRTIQRRILGLTDDAHAAFTELLGDLVVGDGAADHDGPTLPFCG